MLRRRGVDPVFSSSEPSIVPRPCEALVRKSFPDGLTKIAFAIAAGLG